MMRDTQVARVVHKTVVAWPYRLRPDAKRSYPGVSPLPGDWAAVKAAGLMESLGAVEVTPTPKPEEPDGMDVVEVWPEYVDGYVMQRWALVAEPPKPLVPVGPLPDFTSITIPAASRYRYHQAVIVDTPRGKVPVWSDGAQWLYLSDNKPTGAV